MKSKKQLLLAAILLLAALPACMLFTGSRAPAETDRPPIQVTSGPTVSATALASRESQLTPAPALSPTSTPAPTQTAQPRPLTTTLVHISAPSLKDNLLHEPLEQAVKIYLPPSYDASNLHYPVIYFLPGYGGSNDGDSNYFPVDDLANLIAVGQLSEMILVVPNGKNVLHGGFYVNSPVTGNWEDFIVKDVVGYIDANYRTIQAPEGRGIGGHSMGGFGSLTLSMRHPDVFGAAYCLSPAFFDEQGLKDSMMFDRDKKIDQFLAEQEKLSQMPEDEAIQMMASYGSPMGFTMAYGVAFAPDTEKGPPFFDYPYKLVDGEPKKNHKIWVRWENGLGGWGEKIWEHRDNLAKLRGIVIDYGAQDRYNWIPTGSEYVARMLTEAGIPNQLYQFDGGHGDRLVERVVTVMLPFFDQVLVDAREE